MRADHRAAFAVVLGLAAQVLVLRVFAAEPPWDVSVKFILDGNGDFPDRPGAGYLTNEDQVRSQIASANSFLCKYPEACATLRLTEIVRLRGVSVWFDKSPCSHNVLERNYEAFEKQVKANPAAFAFKDAQINVYINASQNIRGDCGPIVIGDCYAPGVGQNGTDVIFLGLTANDTTLVHHIGHFLNLCHTYGCGCSLGCPTLFPDSCQTRGRNDFISDTLRDAACWCSNDVAKENFGRDILFLNEAEKKAVNDAWFNIMADHGGGGLRYHLTLEQARKMVDTSHLKFPPESAVRRGDANRDSSLNISDAVYTLEALFLRTTTLTCPELADVNNDGVVDISDPIAILFFLFGQGPAPAPERVVCE